jgi:hypothetical protein
MPTNGRRDLIRRLKVKGDIGLYSLHKIFVVAVISVNVVVVIINLCIWQNTAIRGK